MKSALKIAAILGLVFTLFPSFFVFSGAIAIETHYKLMALGMILWFSTAPFCMKGSTFDD